MAEKTLEEMREAVEEIRAKMAAAARGAGLPECGHGDPFHGDERRF